MSASVTALLATLSAQRVVGILPASIKRVESDSRRVVPGDLYVALVGRRVDGHDFARAAIACGAVAIVVERELAVNAPQIIVADTRRAISLLAAAFFEFPSAHLMIAGVTGTNGKTTTVALLAAILEAAGLPCATIGTLGVAFGDYRRGLANTTPPALELQAELAALRANGAAAVALEVSSHALALERVADVRFAVGVFTNVTRDHLDFHGSMDAYVRAKRRLFELTPVAALNVDDITGRAFAQEFPVALTYAIDTAADLRPANLTLTAQGSRFDLDGTPCSLAFHGRFNVYNALAAAAAARALGIADATIARGLAEAPAIPGRMERIAGDGIDVLVDYAHTPDALAHVLTAARELTQGKLCVVFGCGGDRDPGKRPEMGAIASRLADRVIITSDNPRSESPASIARAIAGTRDLQIVLDRREAIQLAIATAAPGDTIVVAGKGHEAYQMVGAEQLEFDDRVEARAALAERVGRHAPR